MSARLSNNNNSTLAQAGETVVIIDRGAPLADIVPRRRQARVTRAELVDVLRVLRATLHNTSDDSDTVRAEIDSVVDPYVDVDAAR